MIRFRELRKLALLAVSIWAITPLATAETREEPARILPLKAGGRLSLENIDGDVTIEGWNRREVSIQAVKRADGDALDQIKVRVDATESRIEIETEYLESRGGFMGFQTADGSVDYTIKAPSDAILEEIELVNGDVTVRGIAGRVMLNTVNGAITAVGLADDAEIETVNGAIDASFDQLGAGQSVELTTVNGAVMIRIPPQASAAVAAETINGAISSEFDLTVEKGEWIGSSLEGRIGSGDARIELETVNGRIEIKKR